MSYEYKITPKDYGIVCNNDDENTIVKNINKFLKQKEYRKLYKWEDTSVPPPSMPERSFRISHYYCQFMKQDPRWLFDLKPNTDLDNKMRFPDHPECSWLLHTRPVFEDKYKSQEDFDNVKQFFSNLIASLSFPTKLLHTYKKDDEDRL